MTAPSFSSTTPHRRQRRHQGSAGGQRGTVHLVVGTHLLLTVDNLPNEGNVALYVLYEKGNDVEMIWRRISHRAPA